MSNRASDSIKKYYVDLVSTMAETFHQHPDASVYTLYTEPPNDYKEGYSGYIVYEREGVDFKLKENDKFLIMPDVLFKTWDKQTVLFFNVFKELSDYENEVTPINKMNYLDILRNHFKVPPDIIHETVATIEHKHLSAKHPERPSPKVSAL